MEVISDATDEFEKEIRIPEEFRWDNSVNFNGACLTLKQIWMVTESVPNRLLKDCIPKRPEPAEKVNEKLILDRRGNWH